MKFLFVHQNFPGQYLHVIRHLVASQKHEILFLTENNPNHIAGVRKFVYHLPRPPGPDVHRHAREFDLAVLRAEAVAHAGHSLRALGFVPDIIIGHHGWGELLDIQDVWPGVPLLGYFEFFYRIEGLDIGFDPEFPMPVSSFPIVRNKNATNLLALQLPGAGQTPTRFQHRTYPAWARERIRIIPEGADLDACCPDPSAKDRPFELGGFHVAPGERLLTYVARDLEPYRGFHTLMRSLPAVLRQRRDVKVIMVGRDGVSYGARPNEGSWRDHFLREQSGNLDLTRIFFSGRIQHEDFLRLLQRSDAHVYLTYPFVLSWSLREALACGCALVASDTEPVQEFVTYGANGLLTPGLDPIRLAETVLSLLENKKLERQLRAGARRYAERHLRLQDHIAEFLKVIAELTGQNA